MGDGQEYGEFLHKPGHHFTSFDDIRKEIEAVSRLSSVVCAELLGSGYGAADWGQQGHLTPTYQSEDYVATRAQLDPRGLAGSH